MSENGQEWFVAERSKVLARVYLTRRDDLVIRDPGAGRDVGLEYLVGITREGEKSSVRQFGVVLRAARDRVTEEHLNKILRPTMESFLRVGEFPYPVCLLYFTMDDNQGYYTWIAEPTLTEDGKPRLQVHSTADCKKLDREALDKIVSQVDAWYDAFFANIVVGA
jgi:hypothetical protein